jgi:hypothetical protein
MKKSLACFAGDPEQMFAVRLSKLIPFLTPLLIKMMISSLKLINYLCALMPSLMRNVEGSPQLWISEQIKNVVKQRLNSENKRIDLLQLMLDASTENEIKVSYYISSIILFLNPLPTIVIREESFIK